MNKVYMIVENNDGNSNGLGEFVSMKGIYDIKEKALKRLEDLSNKLDGKGFLKDGKDSTRYLYKVIDVELGAEANIFLGGYRK